jgi:NADPH:quinone reductase-like Zn-dependent oxidoreductase
LLLGAVKVVAVGSKDLDRIPAEFGGEGFTVCIDPVWGEPVARALPYAERFARVVHVGQAAGPIAPLRSADVRGKVLSILGYSNSALSKQDRGRIHLEVLDRLMSGRIEVAYQEFKLADVATAWENQRRGKSVVTVG